MTLRLGLIVCAVLASAWLMPVVGDAVAGTVLNEKGKASWYRAHRGLTASGIRQDAGDLSAAHPSLPFGSKVVVTNLRNGRSVIVRINDRGPFIRGRIIDLSFGAAKAVGLHDSGVAKVRVAVMQ